MVVLPAPEGAENMMSFPDIKEFKVSGSKFQVIVIAGRWSETETTKQSVRIATMTLVKSYYADRLLHYIAFRSQ